MRRHRPTPSRHRPVPPPAESHAHQATLPGASAFNLPLDFDTSSVTDMSGMFYVRSAHPAPLPFVGPSACAPLAPPPPHALLYLLAHT